MVDPGTILAIVQMSGKVASLCMNYIHAARDAPADLRVILIRVNAFRGLFKSLDFLDEECGLDLPDELVERCRQAVTELKELLPPLPSSSAGQAVSKREKARRCLATLAWPFKAEKAAKLLREIDECTNAVNLSFTIHTAAAVEDIRNIVSDSERREVYQWLVDVDPSPFHNQVRSLYEPYTGEWVLNTPEWNNWMTGDARCVWIHGIPGAGKTVLASNLIEKAEKTCGTTDTGGRRTCIYYYCDQRKRNEAMPFLRWVLSQLCRQADQVPSSVYQVFKRGTQPTMEDVLGGIEDAMGQYGTVFIFLDAIDESSTWQDILAGVEALVSPRFPNLRLLATSREYLEIETTMRGISLPISMDNPVVTQDISRWVKSKTAKDRNMRRWEPHLLEKVRDMLPVRAQGMFRWAVCQLDCLRRLRQDETAVENALANLPEKLEDIYVRIFELIPEDDWPFVRHTLRWIYFHAATFKGKPMSIFTILDAFEPTQSNPITKIRFYDQNTLKDVCGCLIKVSTNVEIGYQDLIIEQAASYAHYTVREFLEGQRISSGPSSYFKLSADIVLGELLGTAVSQAVAAPNHDGLSDKEGDEGGFDLQWPVFAFVSAFVALGSLPIDTLVESWRNHGVHYQQLFEQFSNLPYEAPTEFVEGILVGEFGFGQGVLDSIIWGASTRNDSRVFTYLLLISAERRDFDLVSRTLLHSTPCDLYHQILSFELDLPAQGSNYDSYENYHFEGSVTEVMAQFEHQIPNGFEFLLDQNIGCANPTSLLLSHLGVHIDMGVNYNMCSRCPALCKRLIDRGASVNGEGYQITPLQIAVYNLDLDAVKCLLENGADPNRNGDAEGIGWGESSVLHRYQDLSGITPLDCLHVSNECTWKEWEEWEAVGSSIFPIVKQLISHGARISHSPYETTLLQLAAFRLDVDLVESLLKVGADPSKHAHWDKDNVSQLGRKFLFLSGKTPLECCLHDRLEGKHPEEEMAKMTAVLALLC